MINLNNYESWYHITLEKFNIKMSEYFFKTVFRTLDLDINQATQTLASSISSGLLAS